MNDQMLRQVRRYRQGRLILLLLAFVLGVTVAYAEQRSWLPICFSDMSLHARPVELYIGPSILRAFFVPLLMTAGLTRTGYYHFSRVCLFVLWFLHGADYLVLLIAPSAWLCVAVMLSVILLLLTIRTDTSAACGVLHKAGARVGAVRLPLYIYHTCLLWGEAILIQFIFYLVGKVAM